MNIINKISTLINSQYDKRMKWSILRQYKEVILYFIFGSAAASVDISVYGILFNVFSVSVIVSTMISVTSATIVGFILNAVINFNIKDNLIWRFVLYSMTSGVGMGISVLILYILCYILEVNGNIAKAISLPIVFLVQYQINSRISFKKIKT